MRFISALLLSSTAGAFSFSDMPVVTKLIARKDTCPTVWKDISKELTAKFLTGGQCNPDARAAIRATFHDCGAWNKSLGATGGCDGSLILAGELARADNKGLEAIGAYLKDLATRFQVSVADTVVFAGAHAIVTCPGGPRIKTLIGRKDSTIPAPTGLLPDVHAPAADLLALFQAKGFDERDLAALIGAHTSSNQFNVDTSPDKVGLSQDSTPGIWDVKFYSETLNPPANVFVFPSDSKLSQFDRVGKEFKGFVDNQGKWNGKFQDAMERMTLFGTDAGKGLVDCTDVLPKSTNVKREFRNMPVFAPRS